MFVDEPALQGCGEVTNDERPSQADGAGHPHCRACASSFARLRAAGSRNDVLSDVHHDDAQKVRSPNRAIQSDSRYFHVHFPPNQHTLPPYASANMSPTARDGFSTYRPAPSYVGRARAISSRSAPPTPTCPYPLPWAVIQSGHLPPSRSAPDILLPKVTSSTASSRINESDTHKLPRRYSVNSHSSSRALQAQRAQMHTALYTPYPVRGVDPPPMSATSLIAAAQMHAEAARRISLASPLPSPVSEVVERSNRASKGRTTRSAAIQLEDSSDDDGSQVQGALT